MLIGVCVAHVLGFGFWESVRLFSTRREWLFGLQCTRVRFDECLFCCGGVVRYIFGGCKRFQGNMFDGIESANRSFSVRLPVSAFSKLCIYKPRYMKYSQSINLVSNQTYR